MVGDGSFHGESGFTVVQKAPNRPDDEGAGIALDFRHFGHDVFPTGNDIEKILQVMGSHGIVSASIP